MICEGVSKVWVEEAYLVLGEYLFLWRIRRKKGQNVLKSVKRYLNFIDPFRCEQIHKMINKERDYGVKEFSSYQQLCTVFLIRTRINWV